MYQVGPSIIPFLRGGLNCCGSCQGLYLYVSALFITSTTFAKIGPGLLEDQSKVLAEVEFLRLERSWSPILFHWHIEELGSDILALCGRLEVLPVHSWEVLLPKMSRGEYVTEPHLSVSSIVTPSLLNELNRIY